MWAAASGADAAAARRDVPRRRSRPAADAELGGRRRRAARRARRGRRRLARRDRRTRQGARRARRALERARAERRRESRSATSSTRTGTTSSACSTSRRRRRAAADPAGDVFHLNDEGKATEIWTLPARRRRRGGARERRARRGAPEPGAVPRRRGGARAQRVRRRTTSATSSASSARTCSGSARGARARSSRDEVVAQFGSFNEATGGSMELTLERRVRRRHARALARAPQADRPDRPDRHMDVKEANVFHLDDERPGLRVLGRRRGPGGDQQLLDVEGVGETMRLPRAPSPLRLPRPRFFGPLGQASCPSAADRSRPSW